MDGSNGNQVKATQTSLRILEEVQSRNGVGLAELADDIDLAKSTIHNHLMTLLNAGYVIKDDGEYRVGLKLLHLGEQARHRSPRHLLAKQHVNALASEINEEVDFTMEEYGRMISIYHAAKEGRETNLQSGSYFYMHNNAAGKATLANLPRSRVDDIVDQWGLPAYTEHTITSREQLTEELSKIREQGYATNDQELIEGFCAISMIAEMPEGGIFGALSVGGPMYRINSEQQMIVDRLEQQIDALEADLATESYPKENWWQPFRQLSPGELSISHTRE